MDEFFIGWLPMPAGYRRVVVPAAVLLIVLAGAVGVIAAVSRRPAGQGVWEGDQRTIEGVVYAEPCALLRTMHEGKVRTVLLVEEGKFGAAERVRSFDGQAVRVTGTLMHREGRWMVEVSEIEAASGGHFPPRERVFVGERVLAGEVIDPKCYLGAMRPGGGKTHKACAALCLLGGVPPMLAVREGEGEAFYLLLDGEGRLATEMSVPFVGEPVEVRGTEWREDDLRILRIEEKGIRRR